MTASSAEAGASVFSIAYANIIDPPFLRRNVRETLISITAMGSSLSILKPSFRGLKAHDEVVCCDDCGTDLEQDVPPAKRRRIEPSPHEDEHSIRRPLGQVSNGSRSYPKALHKSNGIDPTSFYGKPKAGWPKALGARFPDRGPSIERAIKNLIPNHPTDYSLSESRRARTFKFQIIKHAD
jgi:hypothetical protein